MSVHKCECLIMYVTHSDEVQTDIISPRQSGTYSTYKYPMVQKVESRQLEKEQASKDVAMHVCMYVTHFFHEPSLSPSPL